MSSACNCGPHRKCMRCRRSHDGVDTAKEYNYPVEWVSKSVSNQQNAVIVQGKFISRRFQSVEHKTFVTPLDSDSTSYGQQILLDQKNRTGWKRFSNRFDPEQLNAIIANKRIVTWKGPDIFVGKVTQNGTETIGTIYRKVDTDTGTGRWKLCYLDENEAEVELGGDSTLLPCHVLCDTISVAEASVKNQY